MLQEALQAPQAVQRLLAAETPRLAEIGSHWRRDPPRAMLTVARGSSDHAAHYFAYLVMARLGRLVTSLPMSVLTLHQSRLDGDGLVALAFSQSGRSPDLVMPIAALGERGACTLAIVNDAGSPLARAARQVVPLHAGDETSVAATKSFISQLTAGAALVAAWQADAGSLNALAALPGALQQAAAADWGAGVDALADVSGLYVVGRGTSLPLAQEAALKLKEVCGIHAEAFSGAELRHGPMALVEPGFVVLLFAPRGPAQAGLLALAAELRDRGVLVLLAAPEGTVGATLPLVPAGHPDLDPITAVQSLYPMVEALARRRRRNPDRPPHLSKVTQTS